MVWPRIVNSVTSKTQRMRFKENIIPQFLFINRSNIGKETRGAVVGV